MYALSLFLAEVLVTLNEHQHRLTLGYSLLQRMKFSYMHKRV